LIDRSNNIRHMARKVTSPRPRGRPRATPERDGRRERLLDVATRLFVERGYAEVGVREIARAADATPGMIAYYFGDKIGLYEAMFDRVFERLIGEIQTLAADPAPDVDPIDAFLAVYVRTIARAPWVPQFILREVATREGPLRRRFVERYGRRIAGIAPALFAREVQSGQLRRDLDPVLTLISVIALCVFPFVAGPVMAPVLGLKLDDEFVERLIAHNARLLREGVRRRKEDA
jgi:AcrR family transcriptional regulator